MKLDARIVRLPIVSAQSGADGRGMRACTKIRKEGFLCMQLINYPVSLVDFGDHNNCNAYNATASLVIM